MPAATAGARRKERRGRVGTPTRHSSGSGRPGRLRQYPTHQAQAFGAARRPVSNSDTLYCCSTSRKIPRGEKILHGGGRAVLSGPVKTFLTGGRVCKDPRATRYASHACAQSWRRFAFQRRLFPARFCHNSRAVFRLWQLWQRLSRLFGSQKISQLPLWSTMWSTSVALVRMPRLAHSRQNGSRRSCSGRSSCSHLSVRYIQRQDWASSLRSLVRFGRCASQ